MSDWIGQAIDALPRLIGQNIVGAVVSVVVAFLIRRWIRILGWEQQETRKIAQHAASSSEAAAGAATAAGVAANTAGRHAANATQTSLDTNKAVEWLVTELVMKDEALAESLRAREYLKETVDTAVAQIAYQAAADRPVARETEPDTGQTDDAIFVTGRHRFTRTQEDA